MLIVPWPSFTHFFKAKGISAMKLLGIGAKCRNIE